MPPKSSANGKRKAANGYRLPDPIPEGEIFKDGTKKQWRLGKSIGVGGFGEIYLCSDDVNSPVRESDATHVMKVEPSENGPLFVEMHFYIRAATEKSVEAFKKEKGIPKTKDVGIPCFRGKGLHNYKGQDYRFLVIDRFGKDLQKVFQSGKKLFAPKAAFNLAIRIIDSLEYIHAQGYVHNDIKAQNLLLGHGRKKENDVYLLDFGLVSKYKINDVHLEYKPDARKAHDGTIEYTSRDAHIGAHSRRSDLEILGYNLVHWMSGNLPWMSHLANPVTVHNMKKNFMNDVDNFLQNCFGEENDCPNVLEEFLNYVVGLEYDTKPDYDRCRDMFKSALKKLRLPSDGKVDFSATKSSLKKTRKRNRKVSSSLDVDQQVEFHFRKSARNTNASPTPDMTQDSSELNGARTRSAAPATTTNGDEWCWERILCSDPEMLIRQASRNSEADDDSPLAVQRRAVEAERQKESLRNPTPAMMTLIKKIQEREAEREKLSWHQQLQHLTGNKNKNNLVKWVGDLTPNPLTPAMEEVINMRSKRVSIEVDTPITPEPSDDEEDYNEDSDSSHEEYRPQPAKRPKVKVLKPGTRKSSRCPSITIRDAIGFEIKDSLTVQLTPISTETLHKNNYIDLKNNPVKRRRISIQNDVELIRNKNSPPPPIERRSINNLPTPPATRSSSRRNSRKNSPIADDELDSVVPNPTKKAPKKRKNNKKKLSSISEIIPPSEHNSPVKKQRKCTAMLLSPPQPKWQKALRLNPERMLKKKNIKDAEEAAAAEAKLTVYDYNE